MSPNNEPLSSSELPATGDQTLSIQHFRGKSLVLYFYPRDNTPGCTRESQDFRDRHDAFVAADCAVVGVSRDSLKSHENFTAKYELPFPLISDADEELCRLFDVIKEKNMYGKKVLGIERSTFLLDSHGRIVSQWRKVKVPGHVDEVLETVRAPG
ncbi:MAG: peroxiredoxin [Gammaproteobacteria bacterium]|nr:peroxiredoxin [Gammaproteobacteria bacterium]